MRIVTAMLVAPLVACAGGPHAQLIVPADDAPFEARAEAYRQLRPVARERRFVNGQLTNERLELSNGQSIWHLEDLLVAVPEGSETALAIHQVQETTATRNIIMGSSLGALGLGLTLTFLGLVTASPDPDTGEADLTVAGIGLGVMLVGGIGMLVATGFRTAEDRDRAVRSYERDLQTKLGIEVER